MCVCPGPGEGLLCCSSGWGGGVCGEEAEQEAGRAQRHRCLFGGRLQVDCTSLLLAHVTAHFLLRIFNSCFTLSVNVSPVCVSRWSCDDTVTHYIYQGRVGDNTREYRGVKERGLHVVSQHWLLAVGSLHAHTVSQSCLCTNMYAHEYCLGLEKPLSY